MKEYKMDFFNGIGSVASIIGAFFAYYAWRKASKIEKDFIAEKERLKKKIIVKLQHGGRNIELPMELKRAELTRMEVQGRLGTLTMKEKGKRYSLTFLSKPEFFQQLDQCMQGSDDAELIIPCEENEFNQFDLQN
jgi:hypothetical protein